MVHNPHTPINIKTTPSTHHTNSTITTTMSSPNQIFTPRSPTVPSLKDNIQLLASPPDIHPSELSIPCEDRIHLSRLWCRHNPTLLTYQKRLDESVVDACPGSSHLMKQITEQYTANSHTRQQDHIHLMKPMWENPVQAMVYLRSLTLFGGKPSRQLEEQQELIVFFFFFFFHNIN